MKRSINALATLEILYADDRFIAVHKPPEIPCQTRSSQPPQSLDRSLQYILNEPLRIWTRIDQPASGIVLFFRKNDSFSIKDISVINKNYLAMVEGHPPKKENKLVSRISRDGRKMKAYRDVKHGKSAKLTFDVLKYFEHYSLLKIVPENGRFHQIRYQMAESGHPIKGDVKYGARRKNANRSIHLHAFQYTIRYKEQAPVTVTDYSFPEESLWDLAKELLG